ncbi:MAG: hypothetical protein AABW56_03550 [Nanoarchaeota archaeon]
MSKKELIWMVKLYHSKYNKDESGCLSDFERELGFYNKNNMLRVFLKKLIDEEILEFKCFRLVNSNSFHTYIVNKKKLVKKIKNDKDFKDIYDFFNEEYIISDKNDYPELNKNDSQ